MSPFLARPHVRGVAEEGRRGPASQGSGPVSWGDTEKPRKQTVPESNDHWQGTDGQRGDVGLASASLILPGFL